MDAVVFPEYSLKAEDLNPTSTLTREEMLARAENGHTKFLLIQNALTVMGFLDEETGFGLRISENHYASYEMLSYPQYVEDQKARSVSQAAFSTPSRYSGIMLFFVDLTDRSVSSGDYGFEDYAVRQARQRKSGSNTFVENTLQDLRSMVKILGKELEDNNIPATVKNIIKMWALQGFTQTSLSCDPETMFGGTVFGKRILDLVRYEIPLHTAFTALSWYGNPEYAMTKKFSCSAKELKNFSDIPEYYFNHIIWDEFKLANGTYHGKEELF